MMCIASPTFQRFNGNAAPGRESGVRRVLEISVPGATGDTWKPATPCFAQSLWAVNPGGLSMAKTSSARDEAAHAISEYVAGSYACLAQIEMAKRRLAELKQQVSSALSPIAGRLTEDEWTGLFTDFYWDATELPSEPVLSAFGVRSVNQLSHILCGRTGISCRTCGKELTAKSRAEQVRIRGGRENRCPECAELYREADKRVRDQERDQERQADSKRLAGLRAMRYADYLRSPHWQQMKATALKRSRYRCQLCGANQWVTLDVHHSTYERRGHELPADLIVLCRQCHTKHHTELPAPDGDQPGSQP
jgi:5-methylcytosine-specific restriction endonuclease McrA